MLTHSGPVPVRVTEEIKCTPKPFNEVTIYTGTVRVKGADNGLQDIQ